MRLSLRCRPHVPDRAATSLGLGEGPRRTGERPRRHRVFRLLATKNTFLWLPCLAFSACGSLLTEGTSTGAGIAGAAIAGSVTHNAAVATGIGLGVQAVAVAGLQFAERRVHAAEQAVIASAAGPLNPNDVGAWSISHDVPIELPEHGSVMVTRAFGAASFHCKEIVFTVDHAADRDFYLADVCQDGQTWRWASAEPATARWGNLQ